MLTIQGRPGKDLCDSHLGLTRRDVLIVEDIVDTGLTLVEIWHALEEKGAASLAICSGWKRSRVIHPIPNAATRLAARMRMRQGS